MKRVFLIALLLLSSVCHAQTDTVFWFAPPDLSNYEYTNYGETPIRLVFHAYDQPATVMVEQPANPFFPTVRVMLHPYDVDTIGLTGWVDSIETKPVNTVLNRGFYIHSTAPISCYYQCTSDNRETYTLKGRNALGTDFQILVPKWHIAWGFANEGESFEIIATEDSTLVTVKPRLQAGSGTIVFEGGISAADSVTIVLNRGQSYAMRANSGTIDLMKTHIQSSKPIAVNTTHSQPTAAGPMRYLNVGDQLLPTSFWGTRYALFLEFPTGIGYNYGALDYIDTGIYHYTISGTRTDSITGGTVWSEWWMTPLRPPASLMSCDTALFVEFDRPVGVIQESNKPACGVGCAMLPDVEHSGSHQIAYLRSGTLNVKLNMVVETRHTRNIFFNWDPTVLTAADFQPLVGHPSLSWCSKEVGQYLPAGGRMHIQCDSSRFILGVLEYDTASGASYTILTDYATPASVQFNMADTFCQGDSIHFSYTSYNVDHTRLQCPDGSLHEMPYTITNADPSMSGRFWLYGYDTLGLIPVDMDYIDITISPRNSAEFHETINRSQLPWERFGILFYDETDTAILRPDPLSVCDSLINYHLHIYDTIHDTILYYTCEGELPVPYEDTLFYQEGQGHFYYTGSHGEDSIVTFILRIIPSSDTSVCDSITEDQLPWFAFDTVFSDTVADYIYHLYNEAGCDSIIHYSLYIFWNGDHCDTTLSYPNVVTPNGDGVNDRFVIGGLIEHNCFKYNELTIYDRYGHCVYHKRNIATESDWWNPAAQRAPSGTYFYYFKAHGVNIWTHHRGVIEVLKE